MGIAATFLYAGTLSVYSRSRSLFVPANTALPAGILRGSGNIVPSLHFWAKHALVLYVFCSHYWQAALDSQSFWNSSGGTCFIASTNKGQRIS